MGKNKIYQGDYHKNYSQDLLERSNVIYAISNNLDYRGKIGLDAGCDGGFLSFHLAQNGAKKVYGCDISPHFISNTKKRARELKLTKRTNFKVGDVHNLPYPDSYFDFVVCSEVLEHVENPAQVTSEFHRVLIKEGVLILTTPNILNPAEIFHNFKHYLMWALKKEEITHIQHFTPTTIKKHFKKYGKVEISSLGFGAGFLPSKYFFFLRPLDMFLGKVLPMFAFNILIIAKK